MIWSIPETKGTPPGCRTNHSGCALGKYFYIYGGNKDEVSPRYSTSKVYHGRIANT
jgi:hypothetical protein